LIALAIQDHRRCCNMPVIPQGVEAVKRHDNLPARRGAL
jgi:hypothetical protein